MTETTLTRGTVQVVMAADRPTVIIGERINPTGKDWLKQAIRDGDWDRLGALAAEQAAAGAKVIDVNVAMPGVREADALPRAVEAVQKATDAPLCLDSASPEALAAALPVCVGKVIINSVDGNPEKLDAVLPLARRAGAAVIALAMDKRSGIPRTAAERVAIVERIRAAAAAAGVADCDLIIDCLTLAVSADQAMGRAALETMRIVSGQLGLNVTAGVSNVSFGLPDRGLLNATFLAMACAAGLTSAIVNPHSTAVVDALRASDVLLGRDRRAAGFLRAWRAREKEKAGS